MKKSFSVKNEAGDIFEVDEDKISEAEKDGFLPVVKNKEGVEHRVAYQDIRKAEKDGYMPVMNIQYQDPQVSQLESIGRGALQGAAMEFGDELIAGAKSLLPGVDYEKELEAQRERNKLAAQQNPVSYYGADIAGSFAVPVPGAGLISKGIKGAGMLPKLGRAAATGAVAGTVVGAGASEGDRLEGALQGAATGTLAGGVLTGAGSALSKGITKTRDSFLLGRRAKQAFDVTKETIEEYNTKVAKVKEQATKEGLSPEQLAKRIEEVPAPFGTRQRQELDLADFSKQTDDIIQEMTTPTGAGPLGAVNRKYDTAKIIADAENFKLDVESTLGKLYGETTDPAAQKAIFNSFKKSLGVKPSAQTIEEVSAELLQKHANKSKEALVQAQNNLRKESLKEAKKTLSTAKKDAEAVYRKQLEAKFETDKRRFLNTETNKLRAAKAAGEEVGDIAASIQKMEDELNSTFNINKVQDQATGKAVFEYSARIGEPETGFTLAGSASTKTNFDEFAKLSPKEQAKAVQELASELFTTRKQALEEAVSSMNYKMSIDGPKVTMEAQAPKGIDMFLPDKVLTQEIKPTQTLAKDFLDFSDVQTVKRNLNDATEMALRAGDVTLVDELNFAKKALESSQKNKIPEAAKEALEKANKFRSEIELSDARFLLNEKLNPLQGVFDKGERRLKQDQLARSLQKDLTDISKGVATPRALEIDRAKKALTSIDDPRTKDLVGQLDEAQKTAERVNLSKALFDSGNSSMLTRLGLKPEGMAVRAGNIAGRVSSSGFNKALKTVALSNEQLTKMADRAQSPMLKKYLNAMASSEMPKRKALMFVLMQNAGSKKELEELLED